MKDKLINVTLKNDYVKKKLSVLPRPFMKRSDLAINCCSRSTKSSSSGMFSKVKQFCSMLLWCIFSLISLRQFWQRIIISKYSRPISLRNPLSRLCFFSVSGYHSHQNSWPQFWIGIASSCNKCSLDHQFKTILLDLKSSYIFWRSSLSFSRIFSFLAW